jgi:hypothetical protein
MLRFGTQQAFADFLNLDPTFVSMVVHGNRQLNEREQYRWAGALGAAVQEIFPGGRMEQT